MKLNVPQPDNPKLNISSLIDMVFLLLIYFMVSASLVKSEGDLGIKLPGMNPSPDQVDMPDEQIIEIRESGRVFLNGREYGHHEEQEMTDLMTTLTRYKLASQASQNKALVTVWAADKAKHQRMIDVLNACAGAGIENVTFTSSME
jgi:biopolymer transport protein ExbD